MNRKIRERQESHEHEWQPEQATVIEDGAVICFESCTHREVTSSTHSERHDETFYGYGYECTEERHYRLEAQRIVNRREGQPDVAYLVDNELPYFMKDKFKHVEINGSMTDIYQDEDRGHAVVVSNEARVYYEAE